MKKLWIAVYVDRGETCDGKPRVLKACATKEEAQNEVVLTSRSGLMTVQAKTSKSTSTRCQRPIVIAMKGASGTSRRSKSRSDSPGENRKGRNA